MSCHERALHGAQPVYAALSLVALGARPLYAALSLVALVARPLYAALSEPVALMEVCRPHDVLSPSNVNQCQMRSAPEFD